MHFFHPLSVVLVLFSPTLLRSFVHFFSSKSKTNKQTKKKKKANKARKERIARSKDKVIEVTLTVSKQLEPFASLHNINGQTDKNPILLKKH